MWSEGGISRCGVRVESAGVESEEGISRGVEQESKGAGIRRGGVRMESAGVE